MDNTDLAQALVARGVNPALAMSLLSEHGTLAVGRTIAWYDAQNGRVGPGVLVAELRAGGNPDGGRDDRSLLERDRAYGEQIAEWLNHHFPDLRQPSGQPHPAAVAAVIGLHHSHGKGRLTVSEHGPEIRAAVRAWRKRFDSPAGDFSEHERALIAQRRAARERRSEGSAAATGDDGEAAQSGDAEGARSPALSSPGRWAAPPHRPPVPRPPGPTP